jgi:hypothetical protein
MGNHLFKLFAGKDNKTLDLGRVLWAMSFISYFSATFFAVFMHNQALDYAMWAVGAGTLLAAGGGALALKSGTEPDHKDTPDA